jgi:hypothetical protein
MIFRSEIVSKTWDTWMYYHEGTYYLYYLTSEKGPGDGFGVATSANGINWHDYGRVLGPSDKMVTYLGSGSVWTDPNDAESRRFLCNYSEWRLEAGSPVQNILFAWSGDLIHWHKFGDELMFKIDERFYQKTKEAPRGSWEWPRWDTICVVPRSAGGYYGYWTATPKNALGMGFGESGDGLHWQALEPPQIAWGNRAEMIFLEVGGVHEFDHRYYCMAGDYAETNCGMYSLVSEDPSGPFRPAAKNFGLLRNQSRMNVYFSRFLDTPDGVLVNHHALAKGKVSDEHYETYFAPLKKALVIDGGLYLGWWQGNDGLKHKEVQLSGSDEQSLRFNTKAGIVLEGTLDLPGSLFIGNGDGAGTGILVNADGVTEIGPEERDGTDFTCQERVDREVAFAAHPRFRLLLNNTMLEFYLDDLLIQCYTMGRTADGLIALS